MRPQLARRGMHLPSSGVTRIAGVVFVLTLFGCSPAVQPELQGPYGTPQCQVFKSEAGRVGDWCRLALRIAQGPAHLGRVQYQRSVEQLRASARDPALRGFVVSQVLEGLWGRDSGFSVRPREAGLRPEFLVEALRRQSSAAAPTTRRLDETMTPGRRRESAVSSWSSSPPGRSGRSRPARVAGTGT